MAKNGKSGDNHRIGQVSNRSQIFNPNNDTWVKRNTGNGQFMNVKSDGKPHKGVRKEHQA
jgi:hypothetical protein